MTIYGVTDIIDECTYQAVKEKAVLELDLIHMVGVDKPTKIYAVIGGENLAKTQAFKKWQAAHNGMLAAYRVADIDCASQDCKEARELSNGCFNILYDLYLDRIIALSKNPPDEKWNGAFVVAGKSIVKQSPAVYG